jgi:hypothetical protein
MSQCATTANVILDKELEEEKHESLMSSCQHHQDSKGSKEVRSVASAGEILSSVMLADCSKVSAVGDITAFPQQTTGTTFSTTPTRQNYSHFSTAVSIKPKPPPKPDLMSLRGSIHPTATPAVNVASRSMPSQVQLASRCFIFEDENAARLSAKMVDNGGEESRWTLHDISATIEQEMKANQKLDDDIKVVPTHVIESYSVVQPSDVCQQTAVDAVVTNQTDGHLSVNEKDLQSPTAAGKTVLEDGVFGASNDSADDEDDNISTTSTLTEQPYLISPTADCHHSMFSSNKFPLDDFPDAEGPGTDEEDFDISTSVESLRRFGMRSESVDRALRSSLLGQSHSLSAISEVLASANDCSTPLVCPRALSSTNICESNSITGDSTTMATAAATFPIRPAQLAGLPVKSSRWLMSSELPGSATSLPPMMCCQSAGGGVANVCCGGDFIDSSLLHSACSSYNSNSSGIGSSCDDTASIPNSPL